MTQRSSAFFYLLLSAILFASACGDSESGSDDPLDECMRVDASFTPCGGDLTGTWITEAGCGSDLGTALVGCDEAVNSVRARYSDEATIRFDRGTFTSSPGRVSMDYEVRFPLSCLDSPLLTCDPLSNPGTMECTGIKDCVCVMSMESEDEEEKKTYQVSGSHLTIGESEDALDYEYCIKGDRLYMKLIASEMTGGLSLTMVGSRKSE